MIGRRLASATFLLLLSLGAAGCLGGRATPQIRYYTVALDVDAPRLPFGIQVGTFSAEPSYRSTRIAFRRSRYRLDYYDFNRWAANPQSLLAGAVQNYLDRISSPDDPTPVLLHGRIDRLEAVATGNGLRAVCAITFEARWKDQPLLQRPYVEKVPVVEGDEAEDIVAALSHALEQILAKLTADLAAARADAVLSSPEPHTEKRR
jgi:uncharacterized lipoprotein YmbA